MPEPGSGICFYGYFVAIKNGNRHTDGICFADLVLIWNLCCGFELSVLIYCEIVPVCSSGFFLSFIFSLTLYIRVTESIS